MADDVGNTREKIRDFVERNCVVFEDEAEFTDQDNFFDIGMVNSLFAMKLVTWLEQQWDIEILVEELEVFNFCSVERISNFLREKLVNKLEVNDNPVLLINVGIENKALSKSFKTFIKERKIKKKEVITPGREKNCMNKKALSGYE